jgi:hypothetical protein
MASPRNWRSVCQTIDAFVSVAGLLICTSCFSFLGGQALSSLIGRGWKATLVAIGFFGGWLLFCACFHGFVFGRFLDWLRSDGGRTPKVSTWAYLKWGLTITLPIACAGSFVSMSQETIFVVMGIWFIAFTSLAVSRLTLGFWADLATAIYRPDGNPDNGGSREQDRLSESRFRPSVVCGRLARTQLITVCKKRRTMDTNPYDSPVLDAFDDSSPDRNLPPTRPLGVTLLAILHGLAGLAFGALLVVLLANARQNLEWFDEKGFPLAWFAAFFALFVLLALASSIGMWRGARWSWWLATFYYFFMLFSDICQLLLMTPLKVAAEDYQGAMVMVIRQSVGALICFSLLRYLFKANVLRFFGLSSLRKLRALGILFAVTLILLFALMALVVVNLIRRGLPRARPDSVGMAREVAISIRN